MKHGFSLVELSIVLVILGLLTGGILAGQNLIRAAEIRAVSNEFLRYQSAIHTFRDKYFSLPGDMRNAESFWGTMSTGTCPNATAGTGTQTCNGDGDGQIDSPSGASISGERYTFWQHLANAGLIEGSYTGIAGSGRGDHSVPDENGPRSRLGSTTVWDAWTNAGATSILAFTPPQTTNRLLIGGATTNWNSGAILTVEEAWNIDTKVDDGHATQGKVWAVRWDDCTLATSGTDFQDYDFGVTGKRCALEFRDSF